TALPLPSLQIDPTIFFDLLIPPLLYAAAVGTSLHGLLKNRGAVLSMSVLLVVGTTFGVAGAVSAAATVAGAPMGLAAAVVLGAAVASTDPVAAIAIARRVGMPVGLITLLAGEGLLNDATSLTLFQVGITAVRGHASMLSATGTFFAAAAGGIGCGFLIAFLVLRLRRLIPDATSHGVLSLATPFLAYLPAEALHTSGVLAVVVCGLWMGHRSSAALSGVSRLQLNSTWQLIETLLQGFVFFVIGEQLSSAVRHVSVYPASAIALAVGATVGSVLASRALWIWLGNRKLVRRAHLGLEETNRRRLEKNESVVLWWSGSRGVITLAAAFSIPRTISGHPFPERPLLVFCAYLLVLFTLLLQGTTLPHLARAMHLPSNGPNSRRRLAEARTAAVEAGIQRLNELLEDDPLPDEVVEPLRGRASLRRERSEDRLAAIGREEGVQETESRTEIRRRLRTEMIDAEREELLRWRDSGRLPDRDLRHLERELDYEEGML
ncbi:MAG: Na+/H+ antiporter, partial [Acidimicrobiales bacterium]